MAIDPNWVRENPEEAARQIELLTIERDQYRAAEEKQIAMRQKADEREAALVAHVERLVVAANDAIDQPRSCMMVAEWERTVKDAPTTSLAHRYAEKKAEALEEAANETVPAMHKMANWLRGRAAEERRKAEEVVK